MGYFVSLKSLIIIATVLLALNIFLGYSNIRRQNRINILNSQIQVYENKQVGHLYSQEIAQIEKIPNTDDGLSLIIIFTEIDCMSCLDYEISNLNSFYDQFPDHVEVFYSGKDSSLLKRAGIDFSYDVKHSVSSFLPNYFKIDNILGLIVDQNNILHGFYRFEENNEMKSKKFYKKTISLFESLNK